MICELKKTKYMVINTLKEPEEAIEESVKKRIVQETNIYKYLWVVINKSGNLKDHILDLIENVKQLIEKLVQYGKNTR